MTSERRRSPRHTAKLFAEVEVSGRSFPGSLTRDASDSAILIATQADAAVGDAVTIRCSLGGTVLSVTGKVARRRDANDEAGMAEIAVMFSAQNPLVAEIFRQLQRSDSVPPGAAD